MFATRFFIQKRVAYKRYRLLYNKIINAFKKRKRILKLAHHLSTYKVP